jgi:RNA polymerase sigma-70 factor (ECF subfamily)
VQKPARRRRISIEVQSGSRIGSSYWIAIKSLEVSKSGRMRTTETKSGTGQLSASAADADVVEELSNAAIAYLPRFYKIAMSRVGNTADAEDAVQDALLRAWKNRGQFKGQAHISTWITAILINSARMRFRKNRLRANVSLSDEDSHENIRTISEALLDCRPGPEELCQRWEFAERVIQLSRGLKPTLRAAFELRDLQGLSVGEAAQLLGVRDNTVKARARRARLALRQALERRRVVHQYKSDMHAKPRTWEGKDRV